MPLIKVDLLEGRSDAELNTLLDILHECVLEAFEVPDRDRYQVITEHKPGRMILQDTGLGFERSDKMILVQVYTSPRRTVMKTKFCELVAERLEKSWGLDPKDLMISFMTNTDADWSFGFGRIQYLTGEL